MTPPGRAAALVAAGLIICTAIAILAFALSQRDVTALDYLLSHKGLILAIIVLLIATPLSTYYLVRLWLEGDVSRYPDIDEAWDEGIRALAAEGIDLTDLPLYVVLGVPNASAGSSLIAAAQIPIVVPGCPKGRAPIRWFASSEAIYLLCTGLGRLGHLNELAAERVHDREEAPQGKMLHETLVASSPSTSQTLTAASAASTSRSAAASAATIKGTLVAGGPSLTDSAVSAPSSDSIRVRSHKDADEQSDRLAHLMRRLRFARRPYCANNGVLTIVPRSSLADATFAKEIPAAVRADLATVRSATGLSSAVTLLVSGMESEEGFTELVRRVGVERARTSRFGKGFDVWNIASDESLDALSLHACGSFEDHVYDLFAADEGAEPYSNGKLYTMLSRIRRHFQPRLRRILTDGYAAEGDGGEEPPRLFSGCYFAATGGQSAEQAFVRSVFVKLDQLAEELQWSDEALREDRTYRAITWTITVINAVLLVIAGYFVFEVVRQLISK